MQKEKGNGKDALGKMNKIQNLWYNTIGKIANARIRFFLKLAGFHNIENMEIICNNRTDQTVYTMKDDGIIHRIIKMRIKIDVDKRLK